MWTVSKYHPGSVITISIEPDFDFNDRSGMSSSTHAKAIELWQTDIPEGGDKEKLARTLFCVEDLGMRHAIVPFQQKDIGKVLENLVYHHLIVTGHTVFVGKHGDKEIDFVAFKGEIKTYIQVAYLIPDEKTHEREFGNLLSIPDNCPKRVVSMDEQATGNYKGIEHVSIRTFLMDKV